MRILALIVIVMSTMAAVTIDAQSTPAPSGAARTEQPSQEGRVAVPEPTPQALSYYRSGNVLWFVDNVWGLLVPAALLFTGFSAALRTWATRAGRKWFFTIALYFIAFSAITSAVDLPLVYYESF